MLCEQFLELLARESDGPLPAEALTHLDVCSRCNGLRDDLVAIEVAAREWGSEEPAPPPRIWAAIQAQLETEGLIVAAPRAARRGWFAAWLDWAPRLELAGVSVVLALLAVGLVGVHTVPSVADFPERPAAVQASHPGLESLGRTLDGNMQRVVAALPADDGSVALSLTQNMRIVDNLIVVCEKAVREHPGDSLAREYLYDAYQQKAEFLAVAMDRSRMELK